MAIRVPSAMDSPAEMSKRRVQSNGVMNTPNRFERVVENSADELSPSLLPVMTIAEEIVVGNTAR